jgi:crotonobetainyl-CoA:carnitine CoA-transferase CaiB-like acyl-CoA transferase
MAAPRLTVPTDRSDLYGLRMCPPLPLDGLVVVAVEQAIAAPLATRHLGDLGARVIKIERPDGGDFARGYDSTVNGLSSHFVWVNRGKESVALDLKDASGRDVAERLLARADVFVQNLAPSAAQRLRLDAEAVVARHPRLIACDISGYGPEGPYRDKKAYDLLVQCEAGVVSITGTPDAPSKAGIPVADIAAGVYAYSGILAALYERERTGAGAALTVSLLDGLAEWMGYPFYFAHYGGSPPPRAGSSHAAIAPYGAFKTADGAVQLGIQNEREWVRFCAEVLGDPSLAGDERFVGNTQRVRHRDELQAVVEAVFRELGSDEVVARLEAAAIANARLRGVDELYEHPQLRSRRRWREIDSPAGPLTALLPPVAVAGREARMGAVPALGQHTESVLAWLEE